MNRTRFFTPAIVALAVTVAAGPALAQGDRNNRQRGSRDGSSRSAQSAGESRGNQSRGEGESRQAQPRANAERGYTSSQRSSPPDSRSYNAAQDSNQRGYATSQRSSAPDSRSYNASQNTSQRGYTSSPRGQAPDDRQYATPRYDNGRGANRGSTSYANRGYDNTYYANRDGGDRHNSNSGNNNGYYSNRGYNNGYYPNHGYVAYGGHNNYAWRANIRYGLGISIFAGSPFAFRFDYRWRPSFDYGYTMRPGMSYGGMSFLIEPDHAGVYIDGQFVGVARDFGGQPVPVAAGYHRIELYAEGFEPVAFDITVYPGQVIPYRGSLYPVY
jgi:hypothetical protein